MQHKIVWSYTFLQIKTEGVKKKEVGTIFMFASFLLILPAP